MIRMQKILVPVDFSENSEKAVRYGVELARNWNAEIHFLHVIHQRLVENVEKLSAWGYKGDVVETMRNMVRERENDLQLLVPPEWREGLTASFEVRRGKPAEEVIELAKDHLVDLIVIGTQGHSAIASTLLGGVSQKVVNHAPCPVLVVRPVEHDFVQDQETEE